jgi:hypothetical protein
VSHVAISIETSVSAFFLASESLIPELTYSNVKSLILLVFQESSSKDTANGSPVEGTLTL